MMPTRTGLGFLLTLLTLALSLFVARRLLQPEHPGRRLLLRRGRQAVPRRLLLRRRTENATRPPPRSAGSRRSRRCAPISRVTGAACNPTCQTGCSCGRCNVQGAAPACVTDVGTKKLGEICTIGKDDCQPGYICLLEADTCGQNVGRCYQYCTTNAQCGVTVRDGPARSRSSTATATTPSTARAVWARRRATRWRRPATGARAPALGCYVNAAGATFCDCPNRTTPVVLGGCAPRTTTAAPA